MTLARKTPAREYRGPNLDHWPERVDMAAAFRWTARLGMNEAIANHFSLSVDDSGRRFLINPDGRHFSRIKASDLLLLDADDPATMDRPDAPDATAWGLHGSIHRRCAHARCVMHVHSIHATVLAILQESRLPPVDQNAAMFFDRQVVDDNYGGMALGDEADRCAGLLSDPKVHTMIMGSHGVLVIGASVAEAFNRLYYFERAAETYVRALQTGRPLRVLSDAVAEKTAQEWEDYGTFAAKHLSEIKAILDDEGCRYAE